MSTVDKMLIKGIRSFDPENRHVITFFRPLTLIVGPNGAGKTTIIECLKLSCTGELPPNARSGHSFIHDPKVAGETETKGQIKLRFKTAAGKDVVCIRSFQLTQKASKMEYKAIESVLQTINPHTGEKVCLSYRCADMDREIPALMGVSKAVLENVIFVHQDEANWPLQDPSTLKKKFDDIFSATRYTKALEIIKKLHKDQAQEIKTFKLKLENLQILKDAAYKLRENIAQDEEKTEALKCQMQELECSIQNIATKIHHTEVTLEDLRKLKEEISTKTAVRSTLFKEQQKQYKDLKEENEDTDEELKEWKTKFEERIAMLESKISKLAREENDIDTKSSILTSNIKEYLQQISKRQAEAEAHMSLKKERDTKIKELFQKRNLGSVPDMPFSNEVALNLTNRIESRLMDLNKDLQDKKKSTQAELSGAWDRYMIANERWTGIEAQKKAKAENQARILTGIEEKKIERDSSELKVAGFNLVQIDEREKNSCSELERKSKQLVERNFEQSIRQKQTEIFTTNQEIKVLNREKDIMAADYEDRIDLSRKKAELEDLKKKHKKMQEFFKVGIRGKLGVRFASEKIGSKEKVQVDEAHTMEYDDLYSKSREAEKEVTTLQTKIDGANRYLSQHHKDMESKRRYIESKLQSLDRDAVTIDVYMRALELAKEKRDVHKSKYDIADGMRRMFDPFERVARAHHTCPCCERPFSAEEEDDFVRKQRVKAVSSAEHMKVLAVESSNADSYFQQLEKLRIVYEEYTKIGKDIIPVAEKNLNELNIELEEKTQAHDDVLGVLAQIKADKDVVEALLQPIENADRLFQEIQTLQKKVDDLEYKLDSQGQGAKSMEEIQLELNTLQSKKDSLHNDMEKLREEQRDMENDVSSVQLKWRAAREEKIKASVALRDFEKVEEELGRLAEERTQVELEEKHLSEALGPAFKEREKLLRDYNDLKIKLDREVEKQAQLKGEYEMEVEKICEKDSKIQEYNDFKKGEMLKELEEKKILSESELQRCESRKRELLAELEKSKDLVRSQSELKRNIDDNLDYRKTKAEVDELAHEIELLDERVLKLGGVSSVEAELKKLADERERLLSEINRCRGTLSVFQKNISNYKSDLRRTEYKEIDRRYFDQLIQLKTTEMANKDLDRYYNALDKALMRFHSMKMEEINKIIRELWQQTYRGQDIDYISIHSDSEGAGTRSYSYRVLMQTGDAELEMRGRCSAGQKVLASLIIRLALAETFCLNCGILALDEPTTNLDAPNSESLAAAILRIMQDRKGQENFQLIVITHDERFAHLIGQREHAERYYRVTKDDQ
ncbi:hypothetical protein LguiA_002113 [Lonicera macranthoides]